MSDWDDPGLAALYRRAPASEPAHDSDRRILDAAHDAVKRRHRGRFAAWALAATVLLGVGIGWQVLLMPVALQDPPRPPAAPSAPLPGAAQEPKAEALGSAASPATRRKPGEETERRAPAKALDDRAASGVAARESAAPAGLACRAHWPANDAPRDTWLNAIAAAAATSEVGLAECLRARYDELFADPAR